MVKGESIESLLEPSLRVSRPVAACSRCRSSKIKCTWGISACSACERSGKASSCTSANEEFARGNERSYAAALEAAAERLQRKINASKASNELSLDDASARRGSKGRKISGSQRKEASDVNELVSDFGFLTVNATSRDFHGFASSISFAKVLLAMAVKVDLAAHQTAKLPPRHVVMQSTARYFDKLFVLLPFFSETDFMGSVSRVYQDAQISTATPLDFWYVRLILAITHVSQSRVRGDEHDVVATQHVSAAMQLAERVLRPGSIASVQALLLLVQYAQLDPERLDSWYLMGMTARLVVDLGLHCDLPAEAKISVVELDMRRRVFHCVYALDRLIAMSLSRPFSFTDDSASGVPFPDLSGDSKTPTALGLFLRSTQQCLYLFEIRHIQSSYYQTTRFSSRVAWTISEAASHTATALRTVEKWFTGIPSTFPSDHLSLLRMEALYTQILILSPNQKRTTALQSQEDKLSLFDHCCQFAELLHPVTYDTGLLPCFSEAYCWRVSWVARVFIKLAWSDFDLVVRTAQADAPLQCRRAFDTIRRLTDILDVARQRWNDAEPRQSYEKESAVLATRLGSRLQELSPALSSGSYMPAISSAYQPQQYAQAGQYFDYQQQDGKATSPGNQRRVYQFVGSGSQ